MVKIFSFFFCFSSFIAVQAGQPLKLDIQVTLPSCPGNCDGYLDLTVTGGQPGYKYAWSNGMTTEDYPHACAGSGHVTVTEHEGNTAMISFTVANPLPLSIDNLKVKQPTPGLDNGSIEINVSGGTSPYRFSIDGMNYTASNLFSSLSPGLYVVGIQDKKGCLIQSATLQLSSINQARDLKSYYQISHDEEANVIRVYASIALTIELYDMQGRMLFYEGLNRGHKIELNKLDYGVYVLKISDGVRMEHEMIVKVKDK